MPVGQVGAGGRTCVVGATGTIGGAVGVCPVGGGGATGGTKSAGVESLAAGVGAGSVVVVAAGSGVVTA
jgi:hypothetical protein